MKSFVLILIGLIGSSVVEAQFQLPSLSIPSSDQFQPPPSIDDAFNEQVGRVSEKLPPQRTFEQLFNYSLPQTLPTHPVALFINDIVQLFNISNYRNLFPLTGVRQFDFDVDYNSIPNALQRTFQNAFDRFNNAVNSTITQGLTRIELSLERLNDTAFTVINMTKVLADEGIRDIQSNINKYNETIRECVGSNISEYEKVIPAARDTAIDCVNNKVNDGVAIYNRTRNDINDAIDGARNLSTSINDCSSQGFNIAVVGCYTSSLLNIRRETILLPINMARRFSETDEYISSLRSEVVNCSSLVAEAVAEQSLNATRTIANCLLE
jgi:hypothetical protein